MTTPVLKYGVSDRDGNHDKLMEIVLDLVATRSSFSFKYFHAIAPPNRMELWIGRLSPIGVERFEDKYPWLKPFRMQGATE